MCGRGNPHAFFKLALITNGTGLDLRSVQDSLQYFTHEDEIWIKLDAGTQAYMDRVNRSEVPLEKVMSNILLVARQRPVVIQSLFPLVPGQEPPPQEIDEYILRLHDLKSERGAHIAGANLFGGQADRPSGLRAHAAKAALAHQPAHQGGNWTESGSLLTAWPYWSERV